MLYIILRSKLTKHNAENLNLKSDSNQKLILFEPFLICEHFFCIYIYFFKEEQYISTHFAVM